MNYTDNSSDNNSYSNNDYSVSKNRMTKLRRNDDSGSNDNSDDNSLSTDGYDYEYHSNDSYINELSYSDDGRDQMPDLYMNWDNDSSVNDSDDKTVPTGGTTTSQHPTTRYTVATTRVSATIVDGHGKKEHKISRQQRYAKTVNAVNAWRSSRISTSARSMDENNVQLTQPLPRFEVKHRQLLQAHHRGRAARLNKNLLNTRSVPTPDSVLIVNIASPQQISIQQGEVVHLISYYMARRTWANRSRRKPNPVQQAPNRPRQRPNPVQRAPTYPCTLSMPLLMNQLERLIFRQ